MRRAWKSTAATIGLLSLLQAIVGGKPYNCTARKCGNIYVWRGNRDEFVSLTNQTYREPHRNGAGVLQGKEIRVLISPLYPYVMYNDQIKQLDGFIGNFWIALEAMLKFKSEIIVEDDYDTALDRIANHEADVFLGAVVSNKKLNQAAVYSQPYLLNWYLIGYREPDDSGSSDFFLHAFHRELLITTLLIYSFLGIVLWFGLKLLAKYQPPHRGLSFLNCMLAVVSGFLNQAHELHITFASMRVVILTSLLFGYIIYTSLNAVLVSQLTNLRAAPPAASLDDVAVKRTHSLCVRNNSFVYNYFLDDAAELSSKWKHIVNAPPCGDIRDLGNLASLICKPNVIILENRPVFASVFNLYPIPCNYKFLPGRAFTRYNLIAYHKAFQYRHLLAKSLKRIKSSGILAQLEHKWFAIKTSFTLDKSAGQSPAVNLQHVGAVLIMLMTMTLLSVGILGCELAHRKMSKNSAALT